MKRTILILATLALLISDFGQAKADVVLTFNTPVPGTIQDANGLGTGFTDRLPGTGTALPMNDPNLNLLTNPGTLSITSTNSDVLPPQNFQNMEAVGLSMPSIGTADFSISAMFQNIQVLSGSDQLMLYVGSDNNDFVRAGFHQGSPPYNNEALTVIGYHDGVQDEDGQGWSLGASNIMNGDDVNLSLSRTDGLLTMSWADVTNPLVTGSTPSLSFPWLNNFEDLYVGIYYTNPHDDISRTSEISLFSITTAVPEPSGLIMLALPIIGMLVYLRRRRVAPIAA